ncbi:ABC transporter ATP-binding protein [Bordetella petrii]|uniref:ABC transporter ATP-binding protein n=1 Tax=Bordetella petrii TaxID=94624 RepID=UPI001E57ACD3|nr:ABC transporter ATP-binding protein [Bordetella petrii]MCD0503929.1 ABC transporter ATP-binding protein [Bordetella petrii]
MSDPILKVSNVSRQFGGLKAVDDVSFHASRGDILGLIGPNGAGKTTLFNLLVGLYRPQGGGIELDGEAIAGWRPNRIAARGMTKTFQNVALFPEMTVLDNVLVGGVLRHDVPRARQLAGQNLERVGLSAIAGKLAGELSFPEQARVELARALCTDPKVFLLDEVMAALNDSEMDDMLDLIRQLRDESGITFVVVEHHMRAIMRLCNRILVLSFGKKIAEGTPAEIAANPAVIEAYLGKSLEQVEVPA